MAVDERARHELHNRLDDVLGAEMATTLMRHLPPSGWGDVATRQDLDHLGAQVRSELHRELNATVQTLTRTFVAGNVALVVTIAGLVLAAIRFA